MKGLFYKIVVFITEQLAGIQNGEIRIWDFHYWMDIYGDVKLVLNLICLALVIAVVWDIYDLTKYIIKKVNSKKVESLA